MLRCIGRGSYGEVWLARETRTAIYRAVKVVHRHNFEHDRPFERELSGIQKFEPVSRTHPSQVHILEVGRNLEAGYFHYVMELADDAGVVSRSWLRVSSSQTPADRPQPETQISKPETYIPRTLRLDLRRRGRLPFGECLEISLALTTALEHLHANDLIHRDIKPSNVIFVQGVPKLADIGLVTDVGATISHVGTEGFLPPEGPGTPQADVYSLGKLLYEISTGRDRLDFPELPTFVEHDAEKEKLLELNLICLKACQNDPRKRYQSAREMLAELTLLQSGRSLRRARMLEKRLARLRLAVMSIAAAAVVIAGSVFLIQQQRLKRIDAARSAAQQRKELAERISRETKEQVLDLYTSNGEELQMAGDVAGALAWLAQTFLDETPASTNSWRRRELFRAAFAKCPHVPVLVAHKGPLNAANWSANGKYVVTASDDRSAQIWDAETGEPLGGPLRHRAAVHLAELSPDGSRVLTLDVDGVATIWDSRSGAATPLQASGPIRKAFLSPGGRQVMTISDDQAAFLWEAGGARTRFALRHEKPLLDARFSPDGRLVATGSADGTARIWDSENGEPLTAPLREEGPVASVAFSADGRRLLTASGRRARVWNARSGEPAFFSLQHGADVNIALFSRDNRFIATASADAVRLWNGMTGESEEQLPLVSVHDIAFSPDGRWLAIAEGNRVQLRGVRHGLATSPLIVHNGAVRTVRFNSPGDQLLTASVDGTARLTSLAVRDWMFLSGHDSLPPTLSQWAQFLSGRQISASQKLEPLGSETLRQSWSGLKREHPSDFTPGDIVGWHSGEAQAYEKAGDWFAARFHWEQALALVPEETAFAAARDRTDRALAEQANTTARLPQTFNRIPLRSSDAKPNLIDLSAFYNAALTETWFPISGISLGNDLSALPRGIQKFGGSEFDVRGVVQLSGSALENLGGRFPQRVEGIPIGRKCRRLHFLHGAAWSALAGTHVASYVVHYANAEQREIKVMFGHHLREWWFSQSQPLLTTGAAVAWEGSNAASQTLGQRLRVYQMAWLNPFPDVEVVRLDFRSTMEKPAPFLIAITIEDGGSL
jgi:WD40 repeat protein